MTALGVGSADVLATSGDATGRAKITVVQAPDATTTAATSVTASGATLNGIVNPNGTATQARFQYGTSPTLSAVTETSLQTIGSGTTATPVAAVLTNLQPVTTYYFRVLASSAQGTAQGDVLSFTTTGLPPRLGETSGFVTTCSPNVIACFFFTAMATTVNPNGLPTQAWFEYGTDVALKTFSSTAAQSVGSGTAFVSVQDFAPVQQAPYFRAVARNALGTVRSAIIQTTPGSGPVGLSSLSSSPAASGWPKP